MDTCAGLLRLDGIHTEFGLVALFVDGQDAQRGDGFERIVRFWMDHAHANGGVVADEDERGGYDNGDDDALDQGAYRDQADDSFVLVK